MAYLLLLPNRPRTGHKKNDTAPSRGKYGQQQGIAKGPELLLRFPLDILAYLL